MDCEKTVMAHDLAVVVLAAGQGTRMRSSHPKVMHTIAGRPMIGWVLESVSRLKPLHLVVVIHQQATTLENFLNKEYPKAQIVYQNSRLGTGHAVHCAQHALRNFRGSVLVLCGDTPLIAFDTLKHFVRQQLKQTIAFLGFRTDRPQGYGRLMLSDDHVIERIVEERDATDVEKQVTFCNSGILLAKATQLFCWLGRTMKKNSKHERYLTALAEIANREGVQPKAGEGPEEQFLGVNTNEEKSRAEQLMQIRLRKKIMQEGVTLIDPGSVYLSYDTRLSSDVVVWPQVVFGKGVTVGSGTVVHSFCHLEGVRIGRHVSIGPFARLRPGAVIGDRSKIGNFVELKKAILGEEVKINHLSYVGDAKVKRNANLGAGSITCNFDGFRKHATVIGEGAFVGSNTALVAPVKIGDNVIVGAGSVITRNIPSEAMVIARTKEKIFKHCGTNHRKRRLRKGG